MAGEVILTKMRPERIVVIEALTAKFAERMALERPVTLHRKACGTGKTVVRTAGSLVSEAMNCMCDKHAVPGLA